MNSRSKGCRGEREAAKTWAQTIGGWARRGQQFSGGKESPDVVTSCDGIHLEVKRVEAGNPYRWLEQAVADADTKCPVVLHRRNHEDWIVIVRLQDVPRLAQEIGKTFAAVGGEPLPCELPHTGVPATLCQDAESPRVL
jgi:Holliday junction resolvase